MNDVIRDLARLSSRAARLQQLLTDLQAAAPERSEGTDRSGCVRAVIGASGMPETVRVDQAWPHRLRPETFGAAVVEACAGAMRERGKAWSRTLEESGWTQRADRLGADPAEGRPAGDGGMPAAFRRDPGARPRAADNLAEDAISLAAEVTRGGPAERAAQPTGVSRGRGLTVRLTRSGQVFCEADPRWVTGKSGAELTEALNGALAAARRSLADSAAAAHEDRRSFAGRQERLLAEALAMLENPERSF